MRNHFLRAKGVAAAASSGGVETTPTVTVNNSLNTNEWTHIVQQGNTWNDYSDAVIDKEGDGSIYMLMASGEADFKIIKMNQSGTIAWQKGIEPPSGVQWNLGNGMAVDDDGNLIVIGSYSDSGSAVTSGHCPLIMRIDSDGTLAWAYRFGAGNHSNASTNSGYSVVVNKDNDIFVAGMVRGPSSLGTPFYNFLLRLTQNDSSATLQWCKRLEDSTTSGNLKPQGLKTISNSEYVYFVSNKNTNALNISRIKYDASSIDNQFIYRDTNWTQTNSNTQTGGDDDLMHIDASGNFYLRFAKSSSDLAVIKLDIDLNMEWAKEISANSSTYNFDPYGPMAIGATDTSGDVLFSCKTYGNALTSSYMNLLLICFDSNGNLEWDKIITSNTTNDGSNTTQATTSTNGRHQPYYLDGDTKDNFYLVGMFPGWRNSDGYNFYHKHSGGILKHQSGTAVPAGNYISSASGHHYSSSHSNPPTHWMNISDTSGYTYTTGSWTSSSTSPSASYGGAELLDFPSGSGTWTITDVSSNISLSTIGSTEAAKTYKETL